jgi:hypothetical protein
MTRNTHTAKPRAPPSPAHPPRLLCVDCRLSEILAGAAADRPPAPDGGLTVLGQPSERDAGVIAFTGHSVVFADVAPGWVHDQLPGDDVAAPLSPAFLQALGGRLGRQARGTDLLTVAPALPGAQARPGPPSLPGLPAPPSPQAATSPPVTHSPPAPPSLPQLQPLRLTPVTDAEHPRVSRARRYRDEITVWVGNGAVVVIGRGIAGRWEVAVEVEPALRGKGIGRAAACAARHLVPDGQPLWAQVAPGNAASVRAFLAAGFVPVGAEALMVTE